MPFDAIKKASDFLLADAALVVGGSYYQYLVVADAFLVLSGAVLTSFVGVSGLVHRMALDNCLPSMLAKVNSKGSYPRIIISFFLLCTSILLITGGKLLSLAGVYTISFLGVMSMFAFGNLILKETRTELKRTYHAPLIFVILAFFATLFGILGNIRINPQYLSFFELYFIPSILVVFAVIYQDYILRALLRLTKNIPSVNNFLRRNFNDLIEGKFVVFIHHVDRLHNILEYVSRNETGWNILLVHCDHIEGEDEDDHEVFQEIKETLPSLKKAGVYSHLNIELVHINKSFGPDVIDEVSHKYDVRKNRMLIGSIHGHHPFDYDDLGGVRIIF
jgi:hypothetical protein